MGVEELLSDTAATSYHAFGKRKETRTGKTGSSQLRKNEGRGRLQKKGGKHENWTVQGGIRGKHCRIAKERGEEGSGDGELGPERKRERVFGFKTFGVCGPRD